jgi:hypothetical protein
MGGHLRGERLKCHSIQPLKSKKRSSGAVPISLGCSARLLRRVDLVVA